MDDSFSLPGTGSGRDAVQVRRLRYSFAINYLSDGWFVGSAIPTGCSSYRLSRRKLGLFGAGQARCCRVPRFFLRISDRRTSYSVSWLIALFALPSSSVSCIAAHTTRRSATPVISLSNISQHFQAALPSLYPQGPDVKPHLSPTGGYELKILFNGAHRRVRAHIQR